MPEQKLGMSSDLGAHLNAGTCVVVVLLLQLEVTDVGKEKQTGPAFPPGLVRVAGVPRVRAVNPSALIANLTAEVCIVPSVQLRICNRLGEFVASHSRGRIRRRITVGRGRTRDLAVICIAVGFVAVDNRARTAEEVTVVGAIPLVGAGGPSARTLSARGEEQEHI